MKIRLVIVSRALHNLLLNIILIIGNFNKLEYLYLLQFIIYIYPTNCFCIERLVILSDKSKLQLLTK